MGDTAIAVGPGHILAFPAARSDRFRATVDLIVEREFAIAVYAGIDFMLRQTVGRHVVIYGSVVGSVAYRRVVRRAACRDVVRRAACGGVVRSAARGDVVRSVACGS